MPFASQTLTRRELDVMAILWNLGAGRVAEVQAALHDRLAYTTVLTILRRLEAKGKVRHQAGGRAYLYTPVIARRDVARRAIDQIIGAAFHGSPELLVNRVLADYSLSAEQLRRIRSEIDRRISTSDASTSRPAPRASPSPATSR